MLLPYARGLQLGWRWSERSSRASLEAENTVLRHQLDDVAVAIAETAYVRDAASDLRRLVSFGSEGAGRLGDREAGDRD